MFSRTIFSDKTSEKISTHQRILRAARHYTIPLLPANVDFPTGGALTHFEGANGPDGMPGKHATDDVPYQFINPQKNDKKLFNHIKDHLYNAYQANKHHNQTRLAYELTWLQHMVVDGLTPAHHQPFKDQLKATDPRVEAEANSILKRIFVPGKNPVDLFEKNWERLGPRGVGTNHILFEAGIDFIVMPWRPKNIPIAEITTEDIKKAKTGHFLELYWQAVKRVDALQMFERYEKDSWTPGLASDVREKLIPEAVRAVVLAWVAAIYKGK